MNSTELLQQLAASNDWRLIAPEVALGCLALALLVFEILLPKKHHELIPGLAILGQLGILFVVLGRFQTGIAPVESFGGLLRQGGDSQLMRIFFLLCSVLVSVLGVVALAKQRLPRIEFFHIVIVVTAALMLLVQSNHFVMLFVALETVTVGFYILVSYTRANPLSLEAGLKYLIMGALSSGLLLFGIALLYGAAGGQTDANGLRHTGFEYRLLADFLAQHPDSFLAKVGIVLVLAGVAFKIGAVPFQIWVPDVYQGAPTPVTAFLAVASKAAGFAVLLRLVAAFGAYTALTTAVLGTMAAATIIFGNLAALTQTNVKRLIGLSGVSHAGYLLIGVVAWASQPLAVGGIFFYLFAYLLASFAVFGVMTHLAGSDDADQTLDHYTGLGKTHPFLATVLAIGLGSLAGIPPLAGFVGKLLIFIAAFKAGLGWLLAVAIVGVVVSIYYYFGWIKAAFFETWRASTAECESNGRPARTPVGLMAGTALTMLAIASVLLGFYQGALGDLLGLN
jgi:NADH-quinone oxidoreductase subunit N